MELLLGRQVVVADSQLGLHKTDGTRKTRSEIDRNMFYMYIIFGRKLIKGGNF